jgi:hypothetical protein
VPRREDYFTLEKVSVIAATIGLHKKKEEREGNNFESAQISVLV